MLKATIICIGKLKEKYLEDAVLEYSKRLSAFCNLTIIELPAKSVSLNPTDGEIKSALSSEGDLILKKIPANSYVIPLCIEGSMLDSEMLSAKLNLIAVSGFSEVCYIIGSSYGICENIKSLAHLKLSMSRMTFPHQLARVMLLEQTYRAFKILHGGKYHK